MVVAAAVWRGAVGGTCCGACYREDGVDWNSGAGYSAAAVDNAVVGSAAVDNAVEDRIRGGAVEHTAGDAQPWQAVVASYAAALKALAQE